MAAARAAARHPGSRSSGGSLVVPTRRGGDYNSRQALAGGEVVMVWWVREGAAKGLAGLPVTRRYLHLFSKYCA